MKTKLITKTIVIVLTFIMAICLTACEDERDVPTYGTAFETSQSINGPRSTVELKESHLDTDMLCVHLSVMNNNDSMTASELITVRVVGGDNAKYVRTKFDGTQHYRASDITSYTLEHGNRYTIPYGFITAYTGSNTATVTVIDNYSGEVIGEWTVDVTGIMDATPHIQ